MKKWESCNDPVRIESSSKLRYNSEMTMKTIAGGTVHKMPEDLKRAIVGAPVARTLWDDITPLARNEWICWVESVKKLETRKDHIKRTRTELVEGKRRPCCWVGCPHR